MKYIILFSSLVKMLKEEYFLLGLFVKLYDTCTLSDTEISVSFIDMKVSLYQGYDQYW